MPKASREYVTTRVPGDASRYFPNESRDCRRFQELAQGKRIGWQVFCLRTAQAIEDEGLDPEQVLVASGGALPVIFVNVTFYTEELSGIDLADWEARFELKLLGEIEALF